MDGDRTGQTGAVDQPGLFGPDDESPGGTDADETYTVSQLGALVSYALRRATPEGVWVRGEVHGYAKRGGHAWFDLVERTEDGGLATIGVVLFGGVMERLRPELARRRLRMGDGIAVRIFGELDFYAPHGRLRLRMLGIDTLFTLGQLAADRDRLLRSLAADGTLARQSALALPAAPVHLGVVTRVGSAAWHDLEHELTASGLRFRLTVVDVRVQGTGAEHEIAAGLAHLGRLALDVVLLVRGGGSRTDLATFDTEVVARAVAGCPIPVLTGLGHETDRSIADEAAHQALKTPTACAAALVTRRRAALDRLEAAASALRLAAAGVIERSERRTHDATRRLDTRTMRAVAEADRRLDGAAGRLQNRPAARLDGLAARLDDASDRVARAGRRALGSAERTLDGLAAQVRSADPATLLARGWTITRTDAGDLVRRPADAPTGTTLHTRTAEGTLVSVVVTPGGTT
jgi:exodeoxyribonuclease VII large subunit